MNVHQISQRSKNGIYKFLAICRQGWILNSISKKAETDPFTKGHLTINVRSDGFDKTRVFVTPVFDVVHPHHTTHS